MTTGEISHHVTSRGEFVRAVRELRDSLKTQPSVWENVTLEAYLEALAAWTEDTDSSFTGTPRDGAESPNWQFVLDMLHAARVYE